MLFSDLFLLIKNKVNLKNIYVRKIFVKFIVNIKKQLRKHFERLLKFSNVGRKY